MTLMVISLTLKAQQQSEKKLPITLSYDEANYIVSKVAQKDSLILQGVFMVPFIKITPVIGSTQNIIGIISKAYKEALIQDTTKKVMPKGSKK